MNMTQLTERASIQHGLLSAAQLANAGFSRSMIDTRVRNGFFSRRGGGVIELAGGRASWEQDLLVAVLACSDLAAASHRSAARLWGFRSVDDELEVAIQYPRSVRLANVIVHRSRDLAPGDVTVVDGIPTTTPERTICDLGLIFPEYEVHRILRQAIADGLVLPRDLWSMRQRTSKQGRNGTGVLERILDALPEQVEVAESGLEVHFLEICERYFLPAPVLQLPVRVAGRDFRLDFAWREQRVFVEIDGASFHSTPTQIAADGSRQNLLVRAGWTPLRFTASDLRDYPSRTAHAVRELLESKHL